MIEFYKYCLCYQKHFKFKMNKLYLNIRYIVYLYIYAKFEYTKNIM